eukprot:403351993
MQQIEVNAAFEYHSFLGQLIQFPEVQSVPDPVYLAYLAITVSGKSTLVMPLFVNLHVAPAEISNL